MFLSNRTQDKYSDLLAGLFKFCNLNIRLEMEQICQVFFFFFFFLIFFPFLAGSHKILMSSSQVYNALTLTLTASPNTRLALPPHPASGRQVHKTQRGVGGGGDHSSANRTKMICESHSSLLVLFYFCRVLFFLFVSTLVLSSTTQCMKIWKSVVSSMTMSHIVHCFT